MTEERPPGEALRRAGRTAQRIRGEVDEEFAFHLEQRARELEAAGYAPSAARSEALRRFGDMAAARSVCVRADLEEARAHRRRDLFDEVRQDLGNGLRQLRRRPLLAAAVIVTLALGIGATTALFSVADHVLLRPLPFADEARVVAVWKSDARTGGTRLGPSPGDFADWSQRSTHFAAWGLAEPFGFDETGGERPVPLDAWSVTAGWFDALGIRALHGRLFTAEEFEASPTVVVLGHGFWRRRFGGDPAVIGGSIELDGVPRTIVGVLPPHAEYPEARAVWAPKLLTEAELGDRRTSHMFAVARVADPATLESAAAELASISSQLAAEHPTTNAMTAAQLVTIREQLLGDTGPALLVLFAAVMLVLLIACANVSGLLLARDVERGRELAVRAALGAGRRRLVRQLLMENATLAVLGGALGIGLAMLAVRAFHVAAPVSLPRASAVAIDLRVLAFAAVLTAVTTLLVGMLPAARASRQMPAGALRGARGSVGGRQRDRAHRAIVIAEIAVAFVLVVGAGLLVRSFVTLLANEPGFAVEGRVLLQAHLWDRNPTPEQRIRRAEDIERSLATMPGVLAAGMTTAAPFHAQRVDPMSTLLVHGEPRPRPEEERRVVTILASPGYFDAIGMRVLHGRSFLPADRSDAPRVAMMNESAARLFFAGEDAVGRRVSFGVFGAPQEREIVGVVRDARPDGLESEAQPEVFVPFAQHGFGSVTWIVHVHGDAAAALPQLHERVWQVDPGQSVFAATTLEALVHDTLIVRRFNLLLLGSFSAAAVLLAAIGVYGLISFWTQARLPEIGVRLALGARPAAIVTLILTDALRLAGPGIIGGTAAALLLTRGMRSLLYGVAPTDPLTYLPLALFMATITALAALGPAIRAVRTDPQRVLKD